MVSIVFTRQRGQLKDHVNPLLEILPDINHQITIYLIIILLKLIDKRRCKNV